MKIINLKSEIGIQMFQYPLKKLVQNETDEISKLDFILDSAFGPNGVLEHFGILWIK